MRKRLAAPDYLRGGKNPAGIRPPEFITAANGSNFAGSVEPISPGVCRISLEPQARISLRSHAPGFEYELALAFLRRDRPGSFYGG